MEENNNFEAKNNENIVPEPEVPHMDADVIPPEQTEQTAKGDSFQAAQNEVPHDNYGYNMTPPQAGNGMAIASMILGIVSVVFSCCVWVIALPCAVVGLIFGIISIKKTNLGRGMAIAGIILSGIALLFAFIALFFAIIFSSAVPDMMNYFSTY